MKTPQNSNGLKNIPGPSKLPWHLHRICTSNSLHKTKSYKQIVTVHMQPSKQTGTQKSLRPLEIEMVRLKRVMRSDVVTSCHYCLKLHKCWITYPSKDWCLVSKWICKDPNFGYYFYDSYLPSYSPTFLTTTNSLLINCLLATLVAGGSL